MKQVAIVLSGLALAAYVLIQLFLTALQPIFAALSSHVR